MKTTRTSRQLSSGFSLLELLVVIAIITLLAGMFLPSLARAKALARQTVCGANLRALNNAFIFYVECNDGEFFPYMEATSEGKLWYWGLERPTAGTTEGSRAIDKTKAKLAPYFSYGDAHRICPDVPDDDGYFKPKFELAGYGYAINRRMLAGQNGGIRFDGITRPAETAAWADSMQINTWQAPASPSNPMLEEWYYLDNRATSPATFHFRHKRKCNVAFADGGVRIARPFWLDIRCDGLVGRPERPAPPSQVSNILRLDK